MRVIRVIQYPEGSGNTTLVDSNYPIHYMEHGDSVRVGFEKKTLQKVTFELTNGHKISYEAKADE